MNAMSAAVDSELRISVARPQVVISNSGHGAVVTCSFNGVQHRASIEVDRQGWCGPRDIADMLEALARQVRAS